MVTHIVFVRFFIDYHDPFPFERVINLNDDEIPATLEQLRQEWAANATNRRKLQAWRNEKRKAIEEWNRGAMSYHPPFDLQKAKNTKKKAAGLAPSIEEVFSLAQWGNYIAFNVFSHGISHPYPVASFRSRHSADAATKALQFMADEISRDARAKYTITDHFTGILNARFFVLAESELAPGELFTVRTKIERLSHPKEQQASAEESLLRHHFPGFQQILEMTKATDQPSAQEAKTEGETLSGDPSMHATSSADFTSVRWFGDSYTFNKGQQAAAVRELWEAWKNGTPTLSEKTIGEAIGSAQDHFQLAKVFRIKKKRGYTVHPAWGTMIQSAGKGLYRLVPEKGSTQDRES